MKMMAANTGKSICGEQTGFEPCMHFICIAFSRTERRERNCVALEAVELQRTPAITISVVRLPERRRQEMMVMVAVRRLDVL
jgi:hypothetical protein